MIALPKVDGNPAEKNRKQAKKTKAVATGFTTEEEEEFKCVGDYCNLEDLK